MVLFNLIEIMKKNCNTKEVSTVCTFVFCVNSWTYCTMEPLSVVIRPLFRDILQFIGLMSVLFLINIKKI